MADEEVLRTIADSCPRCLGRGTRRATLPYAVEPAGDGVNAAYRCRRCGNRWQCAWLVESPWALVGAV